MSATDLESQPPVNLFSSNWASMSSPQSATETPQQTNDHIGLTGLFDRMASAKIDGYKADPSREIRVEPAVETPMIKTGTAELVDRAYETGAVLREPGRVPVQSGVVEMGAKTAELGVQAGKEAFKMGGELIGRLFGGGKDPEDKMQEAGLEDPAAQMRLRQPVISGPQSLTLG